MRIPLNLRTLLRTSSVILAIIVGPSYWGAQAQDCSKNCGTGATVSSGTRSSTQCSSPPDNTCYWTQCGGYCEGPGGLCGPNRPYGCTDDYNDNCWLNICGCDYYCAQ